MPVIHILMILRQVKYHSILNLLMHGPLQVFRRDRICYSLKHSFNNNIVSGFNRAKFAWYVIDPLFLRNGSSTPDYIKQNPDEQSSHFVREIYENEIFPYKESPSGIPTNIAVLNVAFYPDEKGQYNYDTDPGPYSAGIDADGKLNNPNSRWGGMMREILTSDFETANIQYIKFWMMDPLWKIPVMREEIFILISGIFRKIFCAIQGRVLKTGCLIHLL